MPYCKYCLNDHPLEYMTSPKTCKDCRKKQLDDAAKRGKRNKSSRRSKIRHSVSHYFRNKRIKHKPFPGDEEKLAAILVSVLKANKYKKGFLSVDHIIPVTHPYVSGLSVSWNLQILPSKDNESKGNYCNLDLESRLLFEWVKSQGL